MDYNEDDSPECLLKSDKMQAYSSEKDDRSVHRTLLSVHPEMGVSLKVENKLLGEINWIIIIRFGPNNVYVISILASESCSAQSNPLYLSTPINKAGSKRRREDDDGDELLEMLVSKSKPSSL